MSAEAGVQADDVEFTARLRQDPGLFEAVYDRYFRDIYRYVAGRLGTQAADDIAAETFLVAFGQRGRFDAAKGGLRPWLFGIATNLIARHRRKEARHYAALARQDARQDAQFAAESHENRVVATVAAERMRAPLARALAVLTRGERDVLLLVALGQLSYEEVAQTLGISDGTVGSRLSRARGKLRNAMNQEQVDE